MAGTARFELAMAESKSDVLPVTLRPNILLLMEVNLVFSNHPETRKEVLHFYDYSSRGYMLPILHTGDSILQILIEPVSLVRDRVLETLRLMASELKSDVSPNSTNPAYLTYIMDYIILYCICQEVFYFSV